MPRWSNIACRRRLHVLPSVEALRCRSYGAYANFLCRSYKDFAPTELTWSIESRSHMDEYARDTAAYPPPKFCVVFPLEKLPKSSSWTW
jgi:hypothetical protein